MENTAESTITLRVETVADPAAIQTVTKAVEQAAAATNPWTTATNMAAEAHAKLEATVEQAAAATNPWTTAANMAAVAAERETVAVRSLNTASAQATTTANGLKAAKDGVARSEVNAGQAFLNFSRAAQDSQYGISGVTNNIEGLVSAMGAGAGLAGVLSVAAVGLQILVENFDIFGTEAAAASEKAREEAAALEATAAKAAQAAADSAAMAEATSRLNTALDQQTEKIKALNEELAITAELRAEERRLQMDAAGAKADSEMAKIDADEKAGRISPQTAAARRQSVQDELEKTKFDAGQQARKEKEAADSVKAEELRKKAEMQEGKAGNLKDTTRGLMTPDERRAAEEEAKAADNAKRAADDQLAAAENARRKAEMRIQNASQGQASPDSIAYGTAEERRAVEAAQQAQAEADQRAKEAADKLEADRQAQNRSGKKDRDAAQKEEQEARKQAAENRREADGLIRRKNQSIESRVAEEEIYNTRRQTRAQTTDSTIDTLNRRQMDQQNQERGEETKKRERAAGEARDDFGDLRQAAEGAGMSQKGLDQMAQALEGFIAGNAAAADTYKRLTEQLIRANADLQKQAAEALASAEAARRGK